jgi:hypothetical protein
MSTKKRTGVAAGSFLEALLLSGVVYGSSPLTNPSARYRNHNHRKSIYFVRMLKSVIGHTFWTSLSFADFNILFLRQPRGESAIAFPVSVPTAVKDNFSIAVDQKLFVKAQLTLAN